MKKNNLLEGLNPQQIQAVTHGEGPLLIIAGAGTGKTTVITRRIAWLIEQGLAKPNEILALTFTEKAAAEMEERVDRLLPYGYVDLWVSTFHAFAQRILESHAHEIGLPLQFKLLTETQLWVLVRQNLERFDLDYYRPLGSPARFLHALIKHFSRAKDELITPEEYYEYAKGLSLNQDNDLGIAASEAAEEAARVLEVSSAYATYQKLLLEHEAFDFGGLITYCYQLFSKRSRILARYRKQFKYILVDEFQDTNYAQYQLVKLLSDPVNNITVVGDDDQSIYKFRGASVSNILKFKDDFKSITQVTLTANYRSYQNLLDLSYRFIQQNSPDRLEDKLKISKILLAQRQGEGQISLTKYTTYHDEGSGVVHKILQLKEHHPDATWNDFAILVRANESAEIFVHYLDRAGIPYIQLSRRGLYRKPIIASLLSYLKLLDNYHESQALFRVLNLPIIAILDEDLAKILDISHRKTYSLYEALHSSEVISQISSIGQAAVRRTLELLKKHTEIARNKSVGELFVQVITDLKLTDIPDEPRKVQELSYLDQFHRKIQDFLVQSDHKLLKDFMAQIELELAAGEQGVLEFDPDVGPETVKIITVHSAKGLEFRFVFLPALADKKFPAIGRSDPIELPNALIRDILPAGDFHIQEERRLFYVAMTRARDELRFSYASDYGGTTLRKPSVFLKNLELPAAAEAPQSPNTTLPLPALTSGVKFSMPKTFSYTSLRAFRECPLAFKYRFILKIPQPGSASLSFGQTMHRTLEYFLKEYQASAKTSQGDLFAKSTAKQEPQLLSQKKLLDLYTKAWVDDWYEDKNQKEDYRKQGQRILKSFYEFFLKHPPRPAYLEKTFKVGLGDYTITGKLDRADSSPEGLVIIDYKTGNPPKDKLSLDDREQLLIYHWAAETVLGEQVAELQYWFLRDGIDIKSFQGKIGDLEKMKSRFLETIEQIVEAVQTNNFPKFHKKHLYCDYENE